MGNVHSRAECTINSAQSSLLFLLWLCLSWLGQPKPKAQIFYFVLQTAARVWHRDWWFFPWLSSDLLGYSSLRDIHVGFQISTRMLSDITLAFFLTLFFYRVCVCFIFSYSLSVYRINIPTYTTMLLNRWFHIGQKVFMKLSITLALWVVLAGLYSCACSNPWSFLEMN